MTDAERDAWAGEVLERIRRHRKRELSGLLAMLGDDLADVFDALAVAPLLAGEMGVSSEPDEFERRRLRHLAELEVDWGKFERI